MNREQIEHIIRASNAILGKHEITIIGSQAILATFDESWLPEAATLSIEVDIVTNGIVENELLDLIDGSIGEQSLFHDRFGIYAHEVGMNTATLPEGWKDRLVPIQNENTNNTVGWCLDVYDLCVSKLCAFREKDIEFIHAILGVKLISEKELIRRVDLVVGHDIEKQRAVAFLQ